MAEKEAASQVNNLLYKQVKHTYNKLNGHFLAFLITIIIPILLLIFSSSNLPVAKLRSLCTLIISNSNLTTLLLSLSTMAILTSIYLKYSPRPIYLVEFSCYKPSDALKITRETFMRQFQTSRAFTDDSITFQRRMLERSGLGQSTYLPNSMLTSPMNPCMATAMDEATAVMFGAIDNLLESTGLKAEDIDVLVTNCSLYGPTPSLSAVIANRYGMREDVKSYNLGGMGCSAGLISIDLAKQLLQVHPDSYALVLSTENMTLNPYFGNNRSMLVTNSLFRMGGAAVLLSNRPSDRCRSKYQLLHTVRTHKGATDRCFSCINQEEDDEGILGVSLSKDLMSVAGDTLKANITTLGPLVLPLSEQLSFLISLVKRKLLRMKKTKPYIPDFKLAFEHFCIHAGGRAVLDELERNLGLSERHMEPSRMTLHRFGNTSSSSLWYELAYCEAQGRIKRGDRLWQIAFGSGFKCNSAVWRALRTSVEVDAADREKNIINPWADEIRDFPVHVPKVVSINLEVTK